jgi:RNA polymerase sigma factor (sigma-70 family)
MTPEPRPDLSLEIPRLRSRSAAERGRAADQLAPWLAKKVYPLLRFLTRNPGDARELAVTVVGQVVLKLGLGLYRKRPDADFLAWAFTVARNEWRQWKREREDTVSLETMGGEMAAPPIEEEEESAERMAAREAVHEALAALPEKDRRLLELRFFQGGLNHREVGDELGITTVNARVRSLRLLRRLRERLALDSRIQIWRCTLFRDQTKQPTTQQPNKTMAHQEIETANQRR